MATRLNGLPPAWLHDRLGSIAGPIIAVTLLTIMVQRHDATLVLAVLVAIVVLGVMLASPSLATLLVVFLLYSNVPSVLVQVYQVPDIVAGTFILLLGIPIIHTLIFRRQAARFDAVFGWMLLLLGIMLLSSLGAVDKSLALGRVQKYVVEGLLLYWLLINAVRTPGEFRRVVWAVLAAAAMLGSMSIYQSVTGNFTFQFGGFAERSLQFEDPTEVGEAVLREAKVRNAMRADGPQLGKNRYAQVMLVLLPLAVMQFRSSRSRRQRSFVLTFGVIILIGGVGLTYSRGAYLAVAAMVVSAAYLTTWLRPSRLAVLALASFIILPVVAPLAMQRMSTLSALTSLSNPAEADGSLRGRATEMLAALNVFLDHPVVGVGPGQYSRFYSVEYSQRPGIKFRDIQVQRRGHMLYFEMGAELGLLGLATFMVIPLLLLSRLRRQARFWKDRNATYADMAMALMLSLVGFLVTALFLSHAFYRFYWFLIALAGIVLLLLRREAAVEQRETLDVHESYARY
jgi:putative inorganic carbon (hco3(-)) transporter